MIKFKKPDLITSLLLLFLVSTPLFMFFLKSINSSVQLFSQQASTITKLEMLDKDFNYFATQKGIFINYDTINIKIEKFRTLIHQFKDSVNNDMFLSSFDEDINQIEEYFHKKVSLLEHTKSYNSIVANSLNYLLDLKETIHNQKDISVEDMQLIENTLFKTMEFYSEIYNDEKELLANIYKIQALAERLDNSNISYFYHHEISILDSLLSISKEQNYVNNLHILEKLSSVYERLQAYHVHFLKTVEIIKNILLVFIVVLVGFILYLHKKSLKDKKELIAYKYAIENSDNSIVITDLDSNIVYVNEAFERETGYKKEEVIGENPKILQSGLMNEAHYKSMYDELIEKERWEGEFINKRKDGSVYYEKTSIIPIIIDNVITNYLAIKLNITEYIEQEKKVEFLALHDRLTSLPNRLYLEKYFKESIICENKKVALFYMDLDGFKIINDSLGHHIGDEVLKVFSSRLKSITSRNDFLSRIGGDEFIALIEYKDGIDIQSIAQRIVDACELPMAIGEYKLELTTSIGISMFPTDGSTLDDLMKYADIAMYKAKTNGKNSFEFFTKELFVEKCETLDIEKELQSALAREEFYLVYQPKYDLDTQVIVGFEALIRWENEKLGFVPPDRFIIIAEELGFINEIGYFVFKRACEDFIQLCKLDKNIKSIAINISTVQLKQENFITNLNTICTEVGIMPSSIELEMTETHIMEDVKKNIESLYELREYGYTIAVDDFGTGYSSFSYLKKLPLNTIKIDKAFVDDICIKKIDKAIANSIIDLAENLGCNTVAEGIEDKNQEILLKEMGCRIGQGYYFSKPQKMEELKVFVQNKSHNRELEYTSV